MPDVAYWHGTIAPGSREQYRTDLTDFMATAADLAGVEAPVGIDGTSLVPILTGEGHLKQRNYLVFEHQGSRGADPDPRTGRWAVVRQDGMKLIRYDNESKELFNLNTDPGETSPLNLTIPANEQIADELEADAIADDVTRGSVQYRTWSGPSGGALQTASNWASPTSPDRYWSAVVANNGAVSGDRPCYGRCNDARCGSSRPVGAASGESSRGANADGAERSPRRQPWPHRSGWWHAGEQSLGKRAVRRPSCRTGHGRGRCL